MASAGAMSLLIGIVIARLLFIQGLNAGTYLADARSERARDLFSRRTRCHPRPQRGRTGHVRAYDDGLCRSLPGHNPGREAQARPLRSGCRRPPFQADLSEASGFVYLARTIPDATAAKIEKLLNNGSLPGIYTMQEPKRFYPAGQLASPLLGMVGIDGQGLSGLEYKYNGLLAGKPGKLVEDMDPAGGQIPGGVQEYQAPVRGDDLVLSIDESLQYDAEEELARAIVAARPTAAWR